MPAIAMTPKAGAHGELCGMMAIKAALEARGDKRSIVLVPEFGARHQPGDGGAARLSRRVGAGARRRHGRPGGGEEAALARGRRHHADQPQHLRPVRARRGGDRRRRARGRRLLLCRRRQLQRHRRQGAARRSRRRCHAHQPAQDVLDPARRRRAGRRAGGAVGGAGAVHAGALCGRRRRRRALRGACALHRRRSPPPAGREGWGMDVERPPPRPSRKEGGAARRQPFGRMCAFHGQMGMFVRALAYMLSHGADGMRQASRGRGAQRQLRARLACRPDVAALRRPALHARGAVRRPLAGGHRRHHARFRQGDDRRGLSTP